MNLKRRTVSRSPSTFRAHLWLAIVASLAAAVAASPRSSQLIDEGLAQLQNQKIPQAAAIFQQAVAADPTDPEAPFFLGVALNRQGKGKAALNELQRSRKLGGNNPDLSFEFGWSYLLERDWKHAIAELTAYEKNHPGERAQASLFLGRAYIAEKDYPKSQAALDRATALAANDQDLKDSIQIAQVRLAQARGDLNPSDERIKTVTQLVMPALTSSSSPGSPLGFTPTLRPGLVLTDSPRPTTAPPLTQSRPWWLNLSLGVGYDSAARGDSPELFAFHAPADPSAFADIRIDSGYALYNHPDRVFWLGYSVFDRTYARQRIRADLLDNQFSANLEQEITPTLRAILRVSDDYTLVRCGNFRNEIGAGVTGAWTVKPDLRLEAGYSYAHDDYLTTTPDVLVKYPLSERFENTLDRDAENHLARGAVYWTIPHTPLQTRAGYFHVWNFAQGSDFDYESNSLFGGLTMPLPCQITADVAYTRTLERYRNNNSGVAVLTKRRDPIDSITLGLTRPIAPGATAYLVYNFNSDGSNIPFYSYSQHVVSLGVTLQF